MDRIRPKGGTEAEWIALDPILMERELALTLNEDNIPTGLKAGDGVSHWSALSYLTGNGNSAQINSDWNAISGKAEILNKPTIPNAQTQSDWNQGNASSVDFIKNKPTIPAAQIQPDWNAISGMGSILNKPTIPSDFEKSYLSLTDTPDSYAGKAKNIPIVTDAENGMDFMGTVLAKLTHLADFPAAYTGQSLKLVRVKADESGVEFITNNLLPDTVKQEIELNAAWKLGSNLYVENVFSGSDLTQVNYWSTSAKTLKLFTKDITYTGGNPATIVLKDEVTGKLLTTTIAYTGSDVSNITKIVS